MSLFNFWKKDEDLFDENSTIEETRFVVLDTETTGFDYDNDRILCIGALVLQKGIISIQDSFEVYIEQDHYDKATAQIHGILKAFVIQRPTELEALQQF